MRPTVRKGEIVRMLGVPGGEGVVDEIAGPNDAGTGWSLTIRRTGGSGASSLVVVAESEVEPTGFAEDEAGQRVILEDLPDGGELRNCLELRLFTEITDGIEAARVAESIEAELIDLLEGATVAIEAERHWSEPYNYELAVTVHPLDNPVEALRALADAGGKGWIGRRDDGWRCELWWSASTAEGGWFVVPEVHSAEVVFLPWSSPARRPESERPLVSVEVPEGVEEPDYDALGYEEEELGDAEAGDEEP